MPPAIGLRNYGRWYSQPQLVSVRPLDCAAKRESSSALRSPDATVGDTDLPGSREYPWPQLDGTRAQTWSRVRCEGTAQTRLRMAVRALRRCSPGSIMRRGLIDFGKARIAPPEWRWRHDERPRPIRVPFATLEALVIAHTRRYVRDLTNPASMQSLRDLLPGSAGTQSKIRSTGADGR